MLQPVHRGGPDARRLQPSVSLLRKTAGRVDDARLCVSLSPWLLPPGVPDR
jgi:hypothetical protein